MYILGCITLSAYRAWDVLRDLSIPVHHVIKRRNLGVAHGPPESLAHRPYRTGIEFCNGESSEHLRANL